MDERIEQYIDKYPSEIVKLFGELRGAVYEGRGECVTEKMWAGLPSFYVGNAFVRLIPFKDHINVEAKAVTEFSEELSGYSLTPKGMLQIFSDQSAPFDVLQKVFAITLGC